MTLVVNNQTDGPSTHVLIVGVGSYPHYPSYKPGVNTVGQIDSAERGAQHVAVWFRDLFHNPERPLATVRLLLSNDQNNTWYMGGNQQVEVANSQNFKNAYDNWMAGATAQPGSTLVFYFSGHGMASLEQQSLVLEDFNQSTSRPMDGAIEYATLEQGVQTQSNASHAWFFLDTCRTGTVKDVAKGQFGQSVDHRSTSLARPAGPRIITVNSTLPGNSAIGLPGIPSVFSEALVAAFQSNAFTNRATRLWACVPDLILDALTGQLERIQLKGQFSAAELPQPTVNMQHSRVPLHFLPIGSKPRMLVSISCDPATDNQTHAMYWQQAAVPVQQAAAPTVRPANGQVWQTELEPGSYDFGALDAAGALCRPSYESIHSPCHVVLLGLPNGQN